MINLKNIHALDHFKRNTADFRERLKRTGEPEVLTVDGKAELVVQSADSYQRMLERLEHLEAVEAIREALASLDRGEPGVPAGEMVNELRRRLDVERGRRG